MAHHKAAHGVTRHFVPEDFKSYAHAELAASPPWVRGVCFLPECGARFAPRRDWQMFCCAACERAGTAEMRRWGHRAALPLLTWRMGKYEAHDSDLRALSQVSRRYVGHLQSAWLGDRRARSEGAI